MIDVNTLTLDSRIRIKILTPGIYIPELHTYTPLQTFASIENINITYRQVIAYYLILMIMVFVINRKKFRKQTEYL